jgi:predicted dehydrogenase
VDPEKSGIGGCIADLGTHAFNLAEFVTGDQVAQVMADLGSVVDGRRLDDDAAVLLRFSNGARGVLIASQIATGEESSVQLKVYGDAGALSWDLKTPDQLLLSRIDGGIEVLVEDAEKLARTAQRAAGLPGAFAPLILAFADIYRDFADVLVGDGDGTYLQGMDAGLRGMAFVERSVLASREQRGWTDLSV